MHRNGPTALQALINFITIQTYRPKVRVRTFTTRVLPRGCATMVSPDQNAWAVNMSWGRGTTRKMIMITRQGRQRRLTLQYCTSLRSFGKRPERWEWQPLWDTTSYLWSRVTLLLEISLESSRKTSFLTSLEGILEAPTRICRLKIVIWAISQSRQQLERSITVLPRDHHDILAVSIIL